MPRGSQQASFGARRGIGERLAVAGGTRGVCSGVCLPRSPQGSGKSCTLRCRRCRPLCSLASPSCATCSCSKGRVTHAGHVQGESSIGPCQLRRNTAGVPIPRHSDGPASATLHGPRCGAGCCGKEGHTVVVSMLERLRIPARYTCGDHCHGAVVARARAPH